MESFIYRYSKDIWGRRKNQCKDKKARTYLGSSNSIKKVNISGEKCLSRKVAGYDVQEVTLGEQEGGWITHTLSIVVKTLAFTPSKMKSIIGYWGMKPCDQTWILKGALFALFKEMWMSCSKCRMKELFLEAIVIVQARGSEKARVLEVVRSMELWMYFEETIGFHVMLDVRCERVKVISRFLAQVTGRLEMGRDGENWVKSVWGRIS